MKKLMIAAATAAMIGGVYAADCKGCHGGLIEDPETSWDIIDEAVAVPGHIWDITIKAKTLVRKSIKCKSGCVVCDDNEKACYLDNGNRTFNGVAWTCYEPCRNINEMVGDEYDGDDVQEKTNVVMWESATQTAYGHAEVAPWTADAMKGGKKVGTITGYDVVPCADIAIDSNLAYGNPDAFRYGKKAEKVAWGIHYEGTNENCTDKKGNQLFDEQPQYLVFDAIALGTVKTYKAKGMEDYLVIEKATGSAVGNVSVCDCATNALVIPVCYEDFTSWCDDGEDLEMAPFYGTITIKYNAKKSASLRKTAGYLAKPGNVFPKYVVNTLDKVVRAPIVID